MRANIRRSRGTTSESHVSARSPMSLHTRDGDVVIFFSRVIVDERGYYCNCYEKACILAVYLLQMTESYCSIGSQKLMLVFWMRTFTPSNMMGFIQGRSFVNATEKRKAHSFAPDRNWI